VPASGLFQLCLVSGAETAAKAPPNHEARGARSLPRVLIIQEKGRHAANEEFREASCAQRALARLGVTSTGWGLNHETFRVPFAEMEKEHDVVLLLENYPETDWLPDLSACRKAKIFWCIDSHVVLERHLVLCARHRINMVLSAVRGHVAAFRAHGGVYFPNAYPEDLVEPGTACRRQDVGFCGNIANRGPWLKAIEKKFALQIDEFVLGRAMVQAVQGYRIHFNRSHSIDINYRTFETLGCRTFLLTNETPGLGELFRIGTDLVTYRDEKDLLEKIAHYLRHPDEREAIARRGHEHARRHHTYTVRMETLLDLIRERL